MPLMHAAPAYSDELDHRSHEQNALVVVAEGDAQRRDRIADMLVHEGYEVLALETGAQLLQYLYNSVVHESRPNLVICDAELEGIEGAQVCKISRAQDTLLPFIVLSRPGTAGDFDSLELSDDACVLPSDVELPELRAAVFRLAGAP